MGLRAENPNAHAHLKFSHHSRGKAFVYDKVKNPGAYIKRINTDERIAEYGAIVEILIDNVSVWTSGSGREAWEI